MDTFWCMVAMLVIACAMNVRRGKSTEVLNREQTEEWKGWMQFIFLLYHYFSAHEVYNSVRVMITSYVWMTGFGNFSFFYLKSDFGIVRLLQMLWRLNFLVLLLCASQGNTYILYYICPLHTFYFLLVYCIMRVWQSANHSAALRWKLLGAAACIYVVWDTDSGLFEKLFFYLGQTPKIGAGSGTMWEWYFRSSLDHWSTLLGMVSNAQSCNVCDATAVMMCVGLLVSCCKYLLHSSHLTQLNALCVQ
jgi:N-acetylneuraminate 9-O-acetyltransferase